MFSRKQTTSHQPPATRGLTLIEMLISMAVTLLMMAAVVNLFANVGAGVRNRRASMELGGQLRLARARLFKDLAGATCAARPKLPSDDHDDGYIELIEGRWSDKNPSELVNRDNIDAVDGNNIPIGLQHATSLVPRDNVGRLVQWDDDNNNGVVDSTAERGSVRSRTSALGDYDDILALTVRSESEPFVGRMPVWDNLNGVWRWRTIQSDLAEVIWYAVENPADGSLGEPGMRTVYRRVLLIAPWVDDLPPEVSSANPNRAISLHRVYYQLSDISFRRVVNGTGDVVRVPNTLADLTKRENRFAHETINFPHEMDLRAIRNDPSTARNNFPEYIPPVNGNLVRPVFHPFGWPFEWDDPSDGFTTPIYTPIDDNQDFPARNIPPGDTFPGDDRTGEDVMLNDVLAFDLLVYDPGAPLYEYQGLIVEPSGDSVFDLVVGSPQRIPSGYGTYVDLGWDDSYDYNPTVTAGAPTPLFQEERRPGYHPINPGPTPTFPGAPQSAFRGTPAVYDTWPYHYEDDGLNQDNDELDLDNADGDDNIFTGTDPLIDEGTNGLDDLDPSFALPLDQLTPADQSRDGVDDTLERETAPPYDTPLRAMQIKIRAYERDTRQIREATVTRNFTPQ